MSDRAQEALRAESKHLSAVASDIAFSGAYLYPFKGILHLLTHPALYTPLKSILLKTLVSGISITTTLFIFTYIPQTTFMALFSGPFAPLSAALLVLAEASAVTSFVARAFLMRGALLDIFDAVLLERGCEGLVSNGRVVKGSSSVRGVWGRLGGLVQRPFGSAGAAGSGSGSGAGGGWLGGMAKSFLLLPLNFIPVIGTLMYVYVSGKRVGPGLHERFFQLRGFDERERGEWVRERRGGYTGLGMASVLLEMVPFASMVFEFSNAVGAALWAADLEKASSSK
ncbi:hypothetical protein BDW59DRAFT_173963 [Aspergillus cavernicola]|uniref:Outer spore wall protein RRT8 n=1 Tax=Aspergillus cavernicola TaxID=176166 RepID=A0ABR4I353_9EURO